MSRLLVLGAGLMGPAAAAEAMADPQVREVGLCDAAPAQIDAAMANLAERPIVARMIARGVVQARGLQRPEAVVAGAAADQLFRDLRARGIRIVLDESPGAARASGSPPTAPGPSA